MRTIDFKKLLKLVMSFILTMTLSVGLTGCSSGDDTESTDSSEDTAETTTDDGTIDYDNVYANLPEVTESDTSEVSDDAKQTIIDAYNDILDTGYFVEKSEISYLEAYYDSSTEILYGVAVAPKSFIPVYVLSNDSQDYCLQADLVYTDDGSRTYGDTIYEGDASYDSLVEYSYLYQAYNYASGNYSSIYEITNFSSQTSGDYEIINIRYYDSESYNVYLYNGLIVQIDLLYYEGGAGSHDVTATTSYQVRNVGYKTADDFDLDTYKETYSSYVGLTYEEALKKVAEEG